MTSKTIRRKADDIRASYSDNPMLSDSCSPELITFAELESDDCENTAFGLNMRRYSQDGHSWNGRPMICVDMRKF